MVVLLYGLSFRLLFCFVRIIYWFVYNDFSDAFFLNTVLNLTGIELTPTRTTSVATATEQVVFVIFGMQESNMFGYHGRKSICYRQIRWCSRFFVLLEKINFNSMYWRGDLLAALLFLENVCHVDSSSSSNRTCLFSDSEREWFEGNIFWIPLGFSFCSDSLLVASAAVSTYFFCNPALNNNKKRDFCHGALWI